MRRIHFFRRVRDAVSPSLRDRNRLEKTMPGETGALAALRLGILV